MTALTPCIKLGLSPRGRGKPSVAQMRQWVGRSIPAWAGETRARSLGYAAAGVYPRVGGGNGEQTETGAKKQGLSPRGRGKPAWIWWGRSAQGSIPAWAGETRHRRRVGQHKQVYPRVGGGNCIISPSLAERKGLSPRGRGKLAYYDAGLDQYGSIPAWAGETTPEPISNNLAGVYPRVGGGNIPDFQRAFIAKGLSPRGRGKHRQADLLEPVSGSIPAWAGETDGV